MRQLGVTELFGKPAKSWLGVPMIVGDRVIGVIGVQSYTEEGIYDKEHLELLSTIASQAAIAIENARLFEETNHLKAFNESIVQGVAEAILIQDAEGILTFANPAAEELTGYTREELIGQHWTTLVPEEQIEKARAEAAKRPQGIKSRYEATLLRKDKARIPVIVSAQPLFQAGKFVGVLSAFTDITERKQTEEKIKLAYAELNRIFNTAADGMRVIDKDFNVLRVNEAFLTLAGISEDEAVSKKCYETFPGHLCHTPDCPVTRILDGEERVEYEEEKKRSDGTGLPCIVTATPFRGSSGELIGIVQDFKDITERKQVETALKLRFINLAEMISRVFDLRDPYVAAHQDGTAQLTRAVGAKMGLDEGELQALYIGSLLHDIGKAAIPEEILRRPGKLTEEEWGLVRTHPQRGYELLKNTNLPWPVAELALHHHERLDGSGYPDGLKGDELCLEVRILAVCNVVDAMSARRPWRPARTKQEIVEELESGKGIKYDPTVVDVILEMIESGELELPG